MHSGKNVKLRSLKQRIRENLVSGGRGKKYFEGRKTSELCVEKRPHSLVVPAVALTCVILAEQLHSHHGEDEDDDTQDECQITESAHRAAHDRDQQVQRWPRLCQLEHSQLCEEDAEGLVFYGGFGLCIDNIRKMI